MKPRLRRLLALTLGGLALAAAYDGYQLGRALLQNRVIVSVDQIAAEERQPYLVFASASRAAADGDYLHALTLYKQVAQDAPASLKLAARYNSANLHLREAMRIRESESPAALAQSVPLFELAKANYRDVLRDEPQHWDARYNLERALRLAPESDESDDGPPPPPLHNERAATTMRGFTLGLP